MRIGPKRRMHPPRRRRRLVTASSARHQWPLRRAPQRRTCFAITWISRIRHQSRSDEDERLAARGSHTRRFLPRPLPLPPLFRLFCLIRRTLRPSSRRTTLFLTRGLPWPRALSFFPLRFLVRSYFLRSSTLARSPSSFLFHPFSLFYLLAFVELFMPPHL